MNEVEVSCTGRGVTALVT